MNKHYVSRFSCKFSEKDIKNNEQQFINKYFENTWHPITETEFTLFKEDFDKIDFSANIPVVILSGIVSFFIILLAFICACESYSGWMFGISILISLILTVILYVRDSIFGPGLSTADVCILPVYETGVRYFYVKGVRNEFYYACAFYGFDKKEFQISMSQVSDTTDIMIVSVGYRTEFMPLSIKEHAGRYRHSGIYIEYSEFDRR